MLIKLIVYASTDNSVSGVNHPPADQMPATPITKHNQTTLVESRIRQTPAMAAETQIFLERFLGFLIKDPEWAPHSKPVDSNVFSTRHGQIWANYPTIIDKPKDLRGIQTDLRKGHYATILAVTDDVHSIPINAVKWCNYLLQKDCYQFDKELVKSGDRLQTLWDKVLDAYGKNPNYTINDYASRRKEFLPRRVGAKGSNPFTITAKPQQSEIQPNKRKRAPTTQPTPKRNKIIKRRTTSFGIASLAQPSEDLATDRLTRRIRKLNVYPTDGGNDDYNDSDYHSESTNHTDPSYASYDEGDDFINDKDHEVDDEDVSPFTQAV